MVTIKSMQSELLKPVVVEYTDCLGNRYLKYEYSFKNFKGIH